MRVLQVTSYYAPAWAYGGPPRVMTEFARGLVERGHDVTVFTTDVLDAKERAQPRTEFLDGVRVERFPNVSNQLAWRNKKYLPPGLVAAAARRVRDFDVVHATDARTVATAAAYLGARRAGIPFCLSAHGSLPGSAGLRGRLKRAYDSVLVRPMLERAALLFAQTDHEVRLYHETGGTDDAVKHLPLPLELRDVPSVLERGFLRSRADIEPDVPLALFLGRIHYLKGLDILIDAIAPVLHARELALAVVGRDDGSWAAIAKENDELLRMGVLRFIGPLYGRERFHAYADADVFCLTPRHWEETSLASLEAAATGTPLVVSEQADVPGLDAAGGGFVVPLDREAIRNSVLTAVRRSEEMGAAARSLIARQHASGAVVDRLDRYLREIFESA